MDRIEKREEKGRFQITQLEERIAPTVTVNLLGIEVANVHVEATISGSLLGLPIDLNVSL
jgi:hypothetical protein